MDLVTAHKAHFEIVERNSAKAYFFLCSSFSRALVLYTGWQRRDHCLQETQYYYPSEKAPSLRKGIGVCVIGTYRKFRYIDFQQDEFPFPNSVGGRGPKIGRPKRWRNDRVIPGCTLQNVWCQGQKLVPESLLILLKAPLLVLPRKHFAIASKASTSDLQLCSSQGLPIWPLKRRILFPENSFSSREKFSAEFSTTQFSRPIDNWVSSRYVPIEANQNISFFSTILGELIQKWKFSVLSFSSAQCTGAATNFICQ